MIYYRTITVNATEPTNPEIGDFWIKIIGTWQYQAYIRIGTSWKPICGGGTYAAETSPDIHYINVVIQETEPTDIIKLGWVWIKESIGAAYIWGGSFVPITA